MACPQNSDRGYLATVNASQHILVAELALLAEVRKSSAMPLSSQNPHWLFLPFTASSSSSCHFSSLNALVQPKIERVSMKAVMEREPTFSSQSTSDES
jgi:hypothetical protein